MPYGGSGANRYRESTIGAAFLTQTVNLDENTAIKFEIWDTVSCGSIVSRLGHVADPSRPDKNGTSPSHLYTLGTQMRL